MKSDQIKNLPSGYWVMHVTIHLTDKGEHLIQYQFG